jgi:hypothetical protein
MDHYDDLHLHASAPDQQFEQFLSYAAGRVPALLEQGKISLTVEGLKRALRVAYTAGKLDQARALAATLSGTQTAQDDTTHEE